MKPVSALQFFSLILDKGMNSFHFPRGSGRTSVPGLCVSATRGAAPPSRPEKSPCFSSFTSLETLDSPLHCSAPGPLAQAPSQLRGSAASTTSHGSAVSFTSSKRAPFRFLLLARPSLGSQRGTSMSPQRTLPLNFSRGLDHAPRLAQSWTSSQRTTQPGAAL